MLYYIFVIAAFIFSVLGYKNYYQEITANTHLKPNKWSWLIWSLSTALETITYVDISQDWKEYIIFCVSSAACIVVTIRIWKRSEWQKLTWKNDWATILTLIACITSIFVWVIFHSAWWAHVALLGALPIAFIPTYIDAVKNYASEDCAAWKLWSIGDTFTIFAILQQIKKFEELPYVIVELLCHFLVVLIVLRQKKKNARRT